MTLKEVCDKYYKIVYRRCLYELNFNEEAAAEVTQQVFLVLCEKWLLLQFHPNLKGWLFKTSYNKLRKAKERHQKNPRIVSMDAEDFREPVRESDCYEQLICKRLEEDLKRYTNEVYAQLTESEKILLGYLRQGMKHAEIAVLMHTTEGAISMRAVRLYRKVRGIVQKIVDNIL